MVYNVVEKVVLDLCRNEVIGKTLDAHIEKAFNTYAATGRLSKKHLSSSSFNAPIRTFVECKTSTAIADKNIVFAKSSKMELMAALAV